MVRVTHLLEAHLVTEGDWIGATEICQLCRIDFTAVQELAELGVLTPRHSGEHWQVPAAALPRLRIVGALMRDLGLNASGAALALDLLETQRALERRIREPGAPGRRSLTEALARPARATAPPRGCSGARAAGCGAGSARTAR